MAITLNGTTGITNDGGYTGDGVSFADTTPANTLVTTTGGDVGVGTSSPNNNAGYGGLTLNGTLGGIFDLSVANTRTGSLYATSSQVNLSSRTAIPIVFETNATERMRIDSSGNVGVGTTSPAGTAGRNITIGGVEPVLVLNASSNRSYSIASGGNFTFTPSSLVFYDNTASATRMRIDSAGELILIGSTAQKATGTTWSNPSDVRLKDNIQDYTKGLPELMQVKVKTWNYNGKGGTIEGTKGLGVVADEIKEILPDTVDNYKAKLNVDDAEDTEIKKFDATEITWLMLKSIQELKAELDSVKAELATLKGAA